jgi:hypothetical protein
MTVVSEIVHCVVIFDVARPRMIVFSELLHCSDLFILAEESE